MLEDTIFEHPHVHVPPPEKKAKIISKEIMTKELFQKDFNGYVRALPGKTPRALAAKQYLDAMAKYKTELLKVNNSLHTELEKVYNDLEKPYNALQLIMRAKATAMAGLFIRGIYDIKEDVREMFGERDLDKRWKKLHDKVVSVKDQIGAAAEARAGAGAGAGQRKRVRVEGEEGEVAGPGELAGVFGSGYPQAPGAVSGFGVAAGFEFPAVREVPAFPQGFMAPFWRQGPQVGASAATGWAGAGAPAVGAAGEGARPVPSAAAGRVESDPVLSEVGQEVERDGRVVEDQGGRSSRSRRHGRRKSARSKSRSRSARRSLRKATKRSSRSKSRRSKSRRSRSRRSRSRRSKTRAMRRS
jgi:hypothetical protein